jgi:pimeloyl-ACP methyl ester carboxylesterase
MPIEVILPKVDMDMTHGTLAVWHVAEGDMVAKGAALFDIETDKAAMEVESPAAGRLQAVTAQPGDRVPVGTVVALIYAEGEVVAAAPAKSAPEPIAETHPSAPIAVAQPAPTPPPESGSTRATPAARAAAKSAGLNIAEIPGSGPLGRVQKTDIPAPDTATPQASPAIWLPQPGPLHISHRKGTGIPLVLIHGFTADSQSWAPLEKCLPPDRPLIRIDLPGHGRSPRRRVAGFADLARMVGDAFDEATRVHNTVHLLGHSLGAALALAIADIRTRQVASLSLIAPAGLGPEIDAATLIGIARATRAESLAPWLRRLTATPDGITDAYARAAMTTRQDPALRAVQAQMADSLFPDGVQPFDLRPALARLQTPTCLIWGKQDHILPWRQVLAADGEIAMHLLSGAGHVPQIECPDRVARIIARHQAMAEIPG